MTDKEAVHRQFLSYPRQVLEVEKYKPSPIALEGAPFRLPKDREKEVANNWKLGVAPRTTHH